MLFHKAKKPQPKEFDRENYVPVLRCSICTGEQVAGLKNIHTGQFRDILLIRSPKDLEQFMAEYGIDTLTKEY